MCHCRRILGLLVAWLLMTQRHLTTVPPLMDDCLFFFNAAFLYARLIHSRAVLAMASFTRQLECCFFSLSAILCLNILFFFKNCRLIFKALLCTLFLCWWYIFSAFVKQEVTFLMVITATKTWHHYKCLNVLFAFLFLNFYS